MNRKEKVVLSLILGIFFTIFVTVSLHRYWQYAAWYYDFGIFYSAISRVARLEPPIIDHYIFPGQNILSDHFHPIIFLLSPFVALFETGETLLVMQTLFITLSGLFVYLTAKEVLKKKFEAFCILGIYFSFIGLHNALITEFHELALLPLPLMLFFYGLVKKHKGWYFLGLIGVLFSKESAFIIPAWFGLVVAFQNKGFWRKAGIATTLFSVAYGFSVVRIIMPAISGKEYYYLNDAMTNIDKVSLLNELKIETIFKSFLSFGFLPIFAPEFLPPIIFNWLTRFTSLATTRHDLGMHYNAEIAPTFIMATLYGWFRVKKLIKVLYKKIKAIQFQFLLFTLTLFALFFSTYILKSPALLFFNPAFYAHTKNQVFLEKLVSNIPDDGLVMAQTNIAAKIANRNVIMLRDSYDIFEPDYIVLDIRAGQEPNNFLGIGDITKIAKDIDGDENYVLFYDQGEQRIYKRVK
ncbi:DUF2079 domain-containing protein [Candidatus Woesebacteria bacterium]|nr:DUF2079 domain-containing protein [Candidatus Woesebacteria bacterium]